MTWTEPAHLQAALACALLCAVLGWLAPPLVARLPEPEPEPEPDPEPAPEPDLQVEVEPSAAVDIEDRKLFARALPPPPPKEPYAELAALPHLALKLALGSAVVKVVALVQVTPSVVVWNAPWVTLLTVKAKLVLSGSVTPILAGVISTVPPSPTVSDAAVITGASLTAASVRLAVELALSKPSEAV